MNKTKKVMVVVEDTRAEKQISQLKKMLWALEDQDEFLVQVIDYERASAALSQSYHGVSLLMFDTTVVPLPEASSTSVEFEEMEKKQARTKVVNDVIKRVRSKNIKIVLFELATGWHPSRVEFPTPSEAFLPVPWFQTDEPDQLVKFVNFLLG